MGLKKKIDPKTVKQYEPINGSAASEDVLSDVPQKEWALYGKLQNFYYKLGLWVARNTCAVVLASILVVLVFALGLSGFTVVTDPVELWCARHYFFFLIPTIFFSSRSSENSITRQQKNYFDESFGPFYRTEQLILSPLNLSTTAVQKDYVQLLFEIEAGVAQLVFFFPFSWLVLFIPAVVERCAQRERLQSRYDVLQAPRPRVRMRRLLAHGLLAVRCRKVFDGRSSGRLVGPFHRTFGRGLFLFNALP